MHWHPRGSGAGRGRLSAMTGLLAAACLAAATGCGSQVAPTASSRPGAPAASGASHGSGGGHGRGERHGLASAAGALAAGTQSGVSGGALFGGTNSLVSLEPKLGRKLAIVRLYLFLGDAFPGKFQSVLAGGRTVLVSLDSNGASYASIAAGQHDAAITSFLQAVNQAAIRYNLGAIYITFEHEPDSSHHRYIGDPAQYVQAWDHVHELAQSEHLDWNDGGRLHWVFILIHNTYSNGRAAMFWPGAPQVDIVAADGYDSQGCRTGGDNGAVTPSTLFNPLLNFASSHGGLPVFVSEWGSDDIPPGAQANFINEMQAYVTGNNKVAAALYWNLGDCNYRVNGHPDAIAALAAMGKAPALQGHTGGAG